MTTQLKAYPAYKDSGVDWLGEVPEDWRVLLSRRFCRVFAGATPSRDEPSYWDRGEIPWLASGDVNQRRIIAASQFITQPGFQASSTKWIRPGSVVIALAGQGKTKGMAALVDIPATCNQSLGVLEPAAAVCDPEFLLYYFESRYRDIRGLVGDLRDGLNLEHLKQLPVPIPPSPQQIAIVRFLNHVSSRIDRCIATRQQTIELLSEEKQAIVDSVVARGMGSGTLRKPSGIDSFGGIPESWGVCRLKRLASRITSGSRGWSDYAADDGSRFVRIANLTRGSIDLDWSDTIHLSLPSDVLKGEGRRTRVMPGDLLLSITAYIGSVAVAPSDIGSAFVSQHVALCRLRGGVDPSWVGYVLLSSIGQNHGRMMMYGGTKQGLSLEDVGSYPILTPPLEEQTRLVERMDRSLRGVDRLIERMRRAITLLRQYRTRLISDVVTGKLDVREAAAKLPNDPDAHDPALNERLEEVEAG